MSKLLNNKTTASDMSINPARLTINGNMLISDTISAENPFNTLNPKIAVTDATTVVFDEGTEFTGKQLRTILKALKKFAEEEYPEEFV